MTPKQFQTALYEGAKRRIADLSSPWTSNAPARLEEVVRAVASALHELGEDDRLFLSPRADGRGDVLVLASDGHHLCCAYSIRMIAPALLLINHEKVCCYVQHCGRHVLDAICELIGGLLGFGQ